MKYQNQRGRHVDRQTEGPKKREKIHQIIYAFLYFNNCFKTFYIQQSLIPPETQSEMDS